MGRTGITYSEVANAASELQGKGINPTVDNVRETLGTGSRSTIGPYLKQWRSKQDEGGCHPGLPPELSSLVKGLYDRLQEEADAKVNAIEQGAREEISIIQQKFEQALAQNTDCVNELNALGQKLMAVESNNEQLKSELEQERKDNFSLKTKLQEYETRFYDKEHQVKVLEKQLDTVQSNLEHYRQSTQTQREQEKSATEREMAFLNQEIIQLKQSISELKTVNSNLNHKTDVLQCEKSQIEKDWYEQRSKTMALQEKIKTDEFTIKKTEDKYNELSDIFSKNQETLKLNLEITRSLENEILVLQEKLSFFKASNMRLEDNLKKLQNDLIRLVQENSNLKNEYKKLGRFLPTKESDV